MTSKGGNRQLQSFTHESACKCSANVNRSLGEKSDEEDMLTFQVSCTPSYSKLRKPIDFLKTAFAEITKPYGKRVAVERVSYVGKDTFLVKVSMNFLEGKCTRVFNLRTRIYITVNIGDGHLLCALLSIRVFTNQVG